MSKPRVLRADDHQLVAEGLRSLLEPEFELVGIVTGGRELLSEASELVTAIREALQGRTYVTPPYCRRVAAIISRKGSPAGRAF